MITVTELNNSIDIKNSKVKNKIINIFEDESPKIKDINYNFFYVVKATLYKPIISSWKEAENKNIINKLDDKIASAISWFNSGKKITERKLELVDIDKDSESLIVLISCVEKQETLKIINKFGAFSRYLYRKMQFSQLVRKEFKQNRLFSTNIKEVDGNLNVINNVSRE